MKCAVLGDPIAHSLSPVLHRAGYDALGLDWTYDAHRVPAGSLAEFLGGLDAEWRGLSLTMPLKREVLGLADRVSERARLAGAANTVVLADGAVHADNTDLPGAVAAVRERYDGPVSEALVLGAGATAASTGLALAELGARRIVIAARDTSRARETLETVRAHATGPDVRAVDLATVEGDRADVVVSTIPAAAQTADLVGRIGHPGVLFEVVYDPWPTPLVAAAAGVVVSGLDLLVHQAALQFTTFTGQPAPLTTMRAAGEDALAARSAGYAR